MAQEMSVNIDDDKKSHRKRKAGRKSEKKKQKNPHVQELTDKQRNPKAFAINSTVQAERRFRRKKDLETKKQHIPVVDRTPLEPPPVMVAVVGPPKVGKTTLIQNIVKHWTKQPLNNMAGPVTIVTGKKQRMTIMECNNDINSMIDLAKVADLLILLVDASFGFEMEVFEFLNVCQVHGMPRILGVLTHLDLLKNNKQLKKTKKTLKHRFWTEVYSGAKLFYLSGMLHGEYLRNEVKNLARFISVIKFRPLVWRTTHPYVIVDRMEDITDAEKLRQSNKTDRNICLYGYIRGVALNKENSVHIPGCGDTKIHSLSVLSDPCPLPEPKKRSLLEKERLIYAPFSGVGGIVYDKDAVYVDLAGSHSHTLQDTESEGKDLVNSMLTTQGTIDSKAANAEFKLFSTSRPMLSSEFHDRTEEPDRSDLVTGFTEETVTVDGRVRRRVVFTSSLDDKQAAEGVEEDPDGVEDDDAVEEDDDDAVEEDDDDAVEDAADAVADEDDEDDDDNDDYLQRVTSEQQTYTPNTIFRGLSKTTEITSKISHTLKQFSQNRPQPDVRQSLDTESGEAEDTDTESANDLQDDENDVKSEDEESEEDSDEEPPSKKTKTNDFDLSAVKWKQNLALKASLAFVERQNTTQNLYKLVYGDFKRMLDVSPVKEDEPAGVDIGGLFQLVSEKQRRVMSERDTLDEDDSTLFPVGSVRDWTDPQAVNLIKDCFVTGKWKQSENAEELLKLNDLEDDDDCVDGDFEDLETGQVSGGRKTKGKPADEEKTLAGSTDTKENLLEKKRKLKARFDAEYDNTEEYSHYNDLKLHVDRQAQLNKSELEGLPDDLRVEIEGYRPGIYVRMELRQMPCELVDNFDPTYPLIVGGLLPMEENIGFIQLRMKKHRWYKKILKTKDPLTISLGWRRFQTLPIFSKLEDNLRHRMLKYTPQHLSCMVHAYGPITPQGTGCLAIQHIDQVTPSFRIAATGSVVEVDKSTMVVKKLKLVGTPMTIYKKTAFVQGMFNSALEVGKFEGAKIMTVSGIRGQIKKAASKPEGTFRATFEDKIKLSDLVFCRTWYQVDVPKFYNPVTSLLLDKGSKNTWSGMKTLGQLKRERNIQNAVKTDSLYTPITRKPKQFAPLSVPKGLQKSLPYKDKPKNAPRNKKNIASGRIAVIREPYEAKVANLMKVIKKNFERKKEMERKAMVERVTNHRKVMAAEELKKLRRQREVKRQVLRTLSKMDKAKNKTK